MSETSTLVSRKAEPSVLKTLPEMSEISPVVSRSTPVVSSSIPGVSKECFKDPAYVHTFPKNNRNVTVFTTSADENLHPANTNSMRDEEKSILTAFRYVNLKQI